MLTEHLLLGSREWVLGNLKSFVDNWYVALLETDPENLDKVLPYNLDFVQRLHCELLMDYYYLSSKDEQYILDGFEEVPMWKDTFADLQKSYLEVQSDYLRLNN